MKKIVAVLLVSSMLLSLAGCSNKEKERKSKRNRRETPAVTEPVSQELHAATVERNNGQKAVFELAAQAVTSSTDPNEERIKNDKAYSEFIFELMKNCAQEADGENVMISADSIFFALSMTAAGANGNTLDQMMNTMMPGTNNVDAFGYAVRRMNSLQNDSLKIANSIWINEKRSEHVYADYLDYVKQNFDAGVDILKFDQSAVGRINGWVSEKTDGMIDELLKDLDSNSLMVLVNAIAFDGKWETSYEDYQVSELPFRNGKGERKAVTMLNGEEGTYFSNSKAEGFTKDYDDGKYTFLTILPKDEKVDINEFIADFSAEDYWEFWENRTHEYTVYTRMPEFSSEYSVDLPEILQSMGMTDCFNADKSDFTNLCDTNAYITDVIHKTFIEVNRTGTKAAAATAVVMTESCVEEPGEIKTVYCDRPFAYAIVDRDTGLPVFLGTVENV